jgi:hypothetical protein
MNPRVVLLLILMALVAPWVNTLTRELFILLRSSFRGEAIQDESLPQPVSPESGPGDVDKRSLNKDAAEEVEFAVREGPGQDRRGKLANA